MNYNTLRNKPTINYRELIGDNTVSEVGGITEEEFNDLLYTDLASYYTKEQIDELFSRSYVYREKSGSIVTFDCPASVNGIDKVVSEIVAVQAGSGDPSPTNVRPISGWSAVDVVVSPTTDVEDGTTYTTTLKDGQGNPLTCYGGQLVNENGVQTLSDGGLAIDMGSLNWKYQETNDIFYATINDMKTYSVTDIFDVMCEIYKRGTFNQIPNDGEFTFYVDSSIMRVKDTSYQSNVTAFKSAVNGKKVLVTKATPQQIPQDSLAIATQDGTNNIWADSGDITVKALDKIIQG